MTQRYSVILTYYIDSWRNYGTLPLRDDIENFFGQRGSCAIRDDNIIMIISGIDPVRVTAYTMQFDHSPYGVALETIEVRALP